MATPFGSPAMIPAPSRSASQVTFKDGTEFENVKRKVEIVQPPPTSNPTDSNPTGSRNAESPATYEHFVFRVLNGSGYWRWNVYFLMLMVGITVSVNTLEYGVMTISPPYHCDIPGLSEAQLEKTSIVDGKDHCSYFKFDYDNKTDSFTIDTSSRLRCPHIEFDSRDGEQTVVEQWGLVCEKALLLPTIHISFMLGFLLGAPFFGAVAERFGRRGAIIISCFIANFAIFTSVIPPDLMTFLIFRFFTGFGVAGMSTVAMTFAIETTSGGIPIIPSNMFNWAFAFGYVILVGTSFFVKRWRFLQLTIPVPSLITLGLSFRIPESPLWLIRNGDMMDAESILRDVARNDRVEGPAVLRQLAFVINKLRLIYLRPSRKSFVRHLISGASSLLKITRFPRMKRIFVCFTITWTALGLGYYGLVLSANILKTNIYVFLLICVGMEFPVLFFIRQLAAYFGRILFCILMMTGGLVLLTSIFFHNSENTFGLVIVTLISKFFVGSASSMVYVYSFKLLPRKVRRQALTFFAMGHSIGAILAVVLVDIVGLWNPAYPLFIIGIILLCGGWAAKYLPETRNAPMPNSLEDGETRPHLRDRWNLGSILDGVNEDNDI